MLLVSNLGFNFTPERVIARAGFVEKRRHRFRVKLDRPLEDLPQPAKAFVVHRRPLGSSTIPTLPAVSAGHHQDANHAGTDLECL